MAKKKNKQVNLIHTATPHSYSGVSTRSFGLGAGIVNGSLRMKKVCFPAINTQGK
jgi:hypothetical protein